MICFGNVIQVPWRLEWRNFLERFEPQCYLAGRCAWTRGMYFARGKEVVIGSQKENTRQPFFRLIRSAANNLEFMGVILYLRSKYGRLYPPTIHTELKNDQAAFPYSSNKVSPAKLTHTYPDVQRIGPSFIRHWRSSAPYPTLMTAPSRPQIPTLSRPPRSLPDRPRSSRRPSHSEPRPWTRLDSYDRPRPCVPGTYRQS